MQINELKAEIVRAGKTIGEFSEEIGMVRSTLSKRFSQPNTFTLLEISNIVEYLELDKERIVDIFFSKKVH